MSSPSGQPWEDRRGMFQRGREVHDPARRPSQGSSGGGVVEAVRRASVTSNDDDAAPPNPISPAGQRRRSSAASNGLFGTLTQHKRGSEDYAVRRGSHAEQQLQSGGFVSGWFNKTFKGISAPAEQKVAAVEQQQQQEKKRGVME